ncbi:hypothetical protein N7467_002518 [Penicillium canescens]|nr:hypothetical protein N7467_002518 [Penicillium canescens]
MRREIDSLIEKETSSKGPGKAGLTAAIGLLIQIRLGRLPSQIKSSYLRERRPRDNYIRGKEGYNASS